MGPLFRHIGKGLAAAGNQVYKVNFNGGDRFFWRLPGGIDYLGTLADWGPALETILSERKITDVILFGDCRDHHQIAIGICRKLAIPVHVFEEGYIRPDWVTFELGGVNGHSSLPDDPQWYRDEAASLPPTADHRQVPSSFRRRAWEGVLYNIADVSTRWYYRNWNNHRPWHPLVEGMGWWRKLCARKPRAQRSQVLIESLRAADEPFFLFPLQLDSDAQIRLHSDFADMAEAIRVILESFARHAPDDVRLVVKEHPLDNGVRDWEQVTVDLARHYGVADRVDFLPGGDIALLAGAARGIVTVNSTSGTLGLSLGVPVVALGSAVFDIAGITHQNGLDAFWTDPTAPDQQTFDAFRRVLIDRCLIPGGFFSEEALSLVVDHAVQRFTRRAAQAGGG